MIERYPINHALYRHFKGKLYYVMGISEHTETGEYLVIYHALYGEGDTFARPYEEFLSEVEEGKENPTGQKYRFELVEDL
jgi:hypothetical protein